MVSKGIISKWSSGPRFNIKMSSYQYRKSHCGDKTVVRSSYLQNEISFTGKMTSLYWIRAQAPCANIMKVILLYSVNSFSPAKELMFPISLAASITVINPFSRHHVELDDMNDAIKLFIRTIESLPCGWGSTNTVKMIAIDRWLSARLQ